MATTVSQIERTQVEDDAERPSSPQTEVCPHCRDTGWVKVFTPWGCPTSKRCQCRPESRVEPDKPIE